MFEQTEDSAGSNWKLWLVVGTAAAVVLLTLVWILGMTSMPLRSFTGELPPLSAEEMETSNNLSQHVKYLSETIGERNLSRAGTLEASADYIKNSLERTGYSVADQSYMVQGQQVHNLEARC